MAEELRITGAQVRMARAFLRWHIATLAETAGVAESTVKRIELRPDILDTGGLDTTRDYREAARDESLGKIGKALTRAGITFLPDNGEGTGIRGKVKKVR